MNAKLQQLLDFIQQLPHLSDEEKNALLKSIKDVDKELEIVNFKLDRTEKVKKTTAILLEETIEELEQKRKAVEAQNRELELESSLERLRTVAMAMNKPDDLLTISNALFKELQALQFNNLRNVIIHSYDDTKDYFLDYDYSDFTEGHINHIPYSGNAIIEKFIADIRKSKEAFSEMIITGNDLKMWQSFRDANNEISDERLNNHNALYYYIYSVGEAAIGISTFTPVPSDKLEVLKRFRNVFDLAFKRYLDITNAETQAREAHIQLALERVRAVAMAMKKSEDLVSVAEVMYTELASLGFSNIRNAQIAIENDERQSFVTYVHSDHEHAVTEASYSSSALLLKAKKQLSEPGAFYQTEYTGKDLDDWRTWRKSRSALLDERELSAASLRWYLYAIGKGHLGISTFETITPEQVEILKRFKNVFELSYTRFDDLQKAEAQAREAQIEAALERVRSRTLAMQSSDELAETAAVLFQQLIGLGIEPNRLYIGIVQDETGDMEMWATDEAGSHIGNKFMFNKNDNASVKKLYDGWKAQLKSVIVDMQGQELEDYLHYLEKILNLPFKAGQQRRVQSVAYFSKGFIGMASADGQGEHTIQLLERFAAVFNLTFTRFNDLKVAEAHALQAEEDLIKLQTEKKRAEDALTELQSTQKQLIQSEKMASLGELTAGIAHEIQNPLNFVNNFSEVSKELLDEMKIELDSGNIEDAKEIMADVIQNLEKINHHGKRADGIVKGMLQHSRSSNGQKELTDINALADEYLRLSYHGLRAKDKSFNAKFETAFDPSLQKVNIIPQDIGRVILNLLTNAFYVVNEKKKLNIPGYEPTVIVSTKKTGDKISISIRDNGNGIPPKVLNKIFQPFFTTKPTGQGTGLGLSLSYDIVTKGHGGELKVNTKESEGTEFIITLPLI